MHRVIFGVLKTEQSKAGRRYIAISVFPGDVSTYLAQMESLVGKSHFQRLLKQKISRDGNEFHITVISPAEFSKIGIESISPYLGHKFPILAKGLGRARRGDNEVYYVVVETPELDSIRQSIHLPKRDLHITLGFKSRDIHNVKKNEETILRIIR